VPLVWQSLAFYFIESERLKRLNVYLYKWSQHVGRSLKFPLQTVCECWVPEWESRELGKRMFLSQTESIRPFWFWQNIIEAQPGMGLSSLKINSTTNGNKSAIHGCTAPNITCAKMLTSPGNKGVRSSPLDWNIEARKEAELYFRTLISLNCTELCCR
jgi:hypothetical protein